LQRWVLLLSPARLAQANNTTRNSVRVIAALCGAKDFKLVLMSGVLLQLLLLQPLI
jgi:hypothetical protein